MDNPLYSEEASFLKILVDDIQEALRQVDTFNSASARRNALRTIISAVEGVAWGYKTHVLSTARELDASTAQLEQAFSEKLISINDQGQMIEQQRYVSTVAMIRLATRTAETICPGMTVDFGDAGWQKLRDAMKMRNRITHPKNARDLAISEEELGEAKTGFDWFLTMVESVMLATVVELKLYVETGKKLVAQLKQGDPETLALYERVHREQDD